MRCLAVVAVLLLAACSPAEEVPPPGGASPPVVPDPVEVGAFAANPCRGVPDEPGYPVRRELPDDRMFADDGRQPACELAGEGGQPVLKARWFLDVRPVPQWRERVRAPEDLTVGGYPALLDQVETDGRPDSLKVCVVYIDLAEAQGLAAGFTGPQADPRDACAEARRFAEQVVHGLP